LAKIYEGMFLLDNDVVRQGWAKAKASLTDLLAKHGATVLASRRWAERKLAYPVRGRRRGTYLLAYYEIPREGIPTLVRDLDLSELVLRYLLLGVEEVPAGELELSAAELAPDFSPPPPPEDGAEYEEQEEAAEASPPEGAAAEAGSEPGEPVLAASAASSGVPGGAGIRGLDRRGGAEEA
jgi:small subunit ribosomal protein S6